MLLCYYVYEQCTPLPIKSRKQLIGGIDASKYHTFGNWLKENINKYIVQRSYCQTAFCPFLPDFPWDLHPPAAWGAQLCPAVEPYDVSLCGPSLWSAGVSYPDGVPFQPLVQPQLIHFEPVGKRGRKLCRLCKHSSATAKTRGCNQHSSATHTEHSTILGPLWGKLAPQLHPTQTCCW